MAEATLSPEDDHKGEEMPASEPVVAENAPAVVGDTSVGVEAPEAAQNTPAVDVAALQEENARLRAQLQAAESQVGNLSEQLTLKAHHVALADVWQALEKAIMPHL